MIFSYLSAFVMIFSSILVSALEKSLLVSIDTAYQKARAVGWDRCTECCMATLPEIYHSPDQLMPVCVTVRPGPCWQEYSSGYVRGPCTAWSSFHGWDVAETTVRTFPSGDTYEDATFGMMLDGMNPTLFVVNSADDDDLDTLPAQGTIAQGDGLRTDGEGSAYDLDPAWLTSSRVTAFYGSLDSDVYPSPYSQSAPAKGVLPYLSQLYRADPHMTCSDLTFKCDTECSWVYSKVAKDEGLDFDLQDCIDSCHTDISDWLSNDCDNQPLFTNTSLNVQHLNEKMSSFIRGFRQKNAFSHIYTGLSYTAQSLAVDSPAIASEIAPLGILEFMDYTPGAALSYRLHTYFPWFASQISWRTRVRQIIMNNDLGIEQYDTRTNIYSTPGTIEKRRYIQTAIYTNPSGKSGTAQYSALEMELPPVKLWKTVAGVPNDIVARVNEAWLRSLVAVTGTVLNSMAFSLSASVSAYPYMQNSEYDVQSSAMMILATVFIAPLAVLLLLPFPANDIVSSREQSQLLHAHGASPRMMRFVSMIWWTFIGIGMTAVALCIAILFVDLPGFTVENLRLLIFLFVTGLLGTISLSMLIGVLSDTIKVASAMSSVTIIVSFSIGFYLLPTTTMGILPPVAFISALQTALVEESIDIAWQRITPMCCVSIAMSVVILTVMLFAAPGGGASRRQSKSKRKISKKTKPESSPESSQTDIESNTGMPQARSEEPPATEDHTSPLRVSDLTFQYPKGGTKALSDVSFDIPTKGEIFALLGSSGSGKTTTANLLVGSLIAQQGKARLSTGYDLLAHPHRAWRHVSLMFQHDITYRGMTIQDHLRMIASIRAIDTAPGPGRSGRMDMGHVIDHILRITGLEDHRHKASASLSGGMRRRLSLGMAMLGTTPTSVLYSDEPTTGLDPRLRRMALRALLSGTNTLVLSTHDLQEAETIADSAVILSGGRVVRAGPMSAVRASGQSGGKALEVTGLRDIDGFEVRLRDQVGAVGSVVVVSEEEGAVRVEFSSLLNDLVLYSFLSVLSEHEPSIPGKQVLWTVKVPSLEEMFIRLLEES
eukprot:gnl/Dysnectes_brevis/5709_a8375_287.p1 GENE.gnl/Dysnectes_brevis/5709_a8375_287~~gnl/Dysnectes_brevis/5709_a8375_287.p1  ORF type:complete len:1052 (-),score=251.00 gnl/Dysnectes_brevis/5709_a8375_287:136-3291(-)